MNRLMLAITVVGTISLVTGCARDRVYYTSTYTTPVYTTPVYTTKTYTTPVYTTKTYRTYRPAVKTYYTPGYAKTYYTPAYSTPAYVYSVGGYQTSPYWDIDYYNDSDAYYYGYDDLGNVGYWGMYNTYQVY